jgi:hypothetical protein
MVCWGKRESFVILHPSCQRYAVSKQNKEEEKNKVSVFWDQNPEATNATHLFMPVTHGMQGF